MATDSFAHAKANNELDELARIDKLLSINARLLTLAKECGFTVEAAEIEAEIENLRGLRRLIKELGAGWEA